MKNLKKFLPGPIALILGVFYLVVAYMSWGGRSPFEAFNVFGAAALPVVLGLFIGIMLGGMFLFVEFIIWYDNWRERD